MTANYLVYDVISQETEKWVCTIALKVVLKSGEDQLSEDKEVQEEKAEGARKDEVKRLAKDHNYAGTLIVVRSKSEKWNTMGVHFEADEKHRLLDYAPT